MEPVFYKPKDWIYEDSFLDTEYQVTSFKNEEDPDYNVQGYFYIKVGCWNDGITTHDLYVRGEWSHEHFDGETAIYITPFPDGEWTFDIEYLGDNMDASVRENKAGEILKAMWDEYGDACEKAADDISAYFKEREDEERYKLFEVFKKSHPKDYVLYKAYVSGIPNAVSYLFADEVSGKCGISISMLERISMNTLDYIKDVVALCDDNNIVIDKYTFNDVTHDFSFKDDGSDLLHINTHNLAAGIIDDCIESVLDKNGITVPDDDRSGGDEEACLYGTTYGNVMDRIEERLISYLEPLAVKTNDHVKDTEHMER